MRAVEAVDLAIAPGEVVGLVGESGSGKSTLGRLILRLTEPTAGRVHFDGADITALSQRRLRALRRQMQVIFQDPYSSLDPRKTVARLIGDAFAIHGLYSRAERRELDLALLFISHDLSVVGYVSDKVMVMYLGRIMEAAPARALYTAPKHPYTEALLSAAPEPEAALRRSRIILQGDLPSPLDPPSGCVFRTRCPHALAACAEAVPPLRPVGPDHVAACIRDDVL